jgi:pyoverdine/dityrosine biosynthesis protein Dit1
MMPDLAQINFLLGLAEIAKTIDFIYREEIRVSHRVMAMFTVISDGSRFNRFLNESTSTIINYQQKLRWWLNELQISDFVEILDYQIFMKNHLPTELTLQKKNIKEQV